MPTRPIVSARMIAKELKITPRTAQYLVAELGLREAIGRDDSGREDSPRTDGTAADQGRGSILTSPSRVIVSTELTSRSCGRSLFRSTRCAMATSISCCASARATDGRMIKPG